MPFAPTFCDLRNHRIFDIVPGRSQAELRGYVSSLKGREEVRGAEWISRAPAVPSCDAGSPKPGS